MLGDAHGVSTGTPAAAALVLGSEAGALKLRVFCWGALLVYIASLCSLAVSPPAQSQAWTEHPLMLRAAGMAGITAILVHKLRFLQRFGFFSMPKGQPPLGAAQLADHVLLLSASGAPTLNLIMYITAPVFNVVTTKWSLVIVFHTLVAVFALGLPPMHAMLQLGCSCLSFGFLAYQKACRLATSTHAASDTCVSDTWFTLEFILAQWLPMALTALMLQVAALARCKPGQQLKDTLALSRPCSTQTVTGSKADKAADFMSELTTARTSNSSSCAASNSKPACVAEELVVPFDGLGVSFLQHLVQPLRPVLLRYHSVVEGLKHWRYSGQVLGVLSIPVGMYCTVNLVLARIGLPGFSVSNLSPEILVLGLVAMFIGGRDSSKLDISAVTEQAVTQISATHSLLVDVLPEHLVQRFMGRMTGAPAPSVPSGLDQQGSPFHHSKHHSQSGHGQGWRRQSLQLDHARRGTMSTGGSVGNLVRRSADQVAEAGTWRKLGKGALLTHGQGGDREQGAGQGGRRGKSEDGMSGEHAQATQSEEDDQGGQGVPQMDRPLPPTPPASVYDLSTVGSLEHSAPFALAVPVKTTSSASRPSLDLEKAPKRFVRPARRNMTMACVSPRTLWADASGIAVARGPPHLRLRPLRQSTFRASFGAHPAFAMLTMPEDELSQSSPLSDQALRAALEAFLNGTCPPSPRTDFPHASGNCLATPDFGRVSMTGSDAGTSTSTITVDMAAYERTMAASHETCTLFFSDIVGFSNWAGKLPPAKVMQTLDNLYTRMDDLILNEFPSLYKVETIGDAYVCAGNLLVPDADHAATMVRFALRVQEEVAKVPRPDLHDGTPLQMRIGLHSGSLMSGIVGKIRRRWCLFGDCMNMAARTESTCPPGCVQLTACTHELAAPALLSGVSLKPRGEVQVKGREQPLMMWLAEAA